uniref:Uncharacterized protein n=1 Tax=Rhizophora mucronata TaxID=61149 RepID=A0A2P2PCZ6_RHIMU
MGTLIYMLFLLLLCPIHIQAFLHNSILRCFKGGKHHHFLLGKWSSSLASFLLPIILQSEWLLGKPGCSTT